MLSVLAYWVHDLDPFAVRFSEGFGIRWYGLAYAMGFLGGALLLHSYYRKGRSPYGPEAQSSLLFALIIGVLVGGRLGYYLLYRFGELLADPLVLFRVWEGGMASHGGFVGVTVALFWFAHRTKTPVLVPADLVVTLAPLGILLGRLANFINGELWGRVSTVPWAVIFPESAPPGTPVEQIDPRHPSQLYAAGLEGLVPFLYLQWRFRAHRPPAGQLAGEFLLLYALMRIVGEFWREPDAPLIGALSRGQFYSLFLLAAGAMVILWARRRASSRPSGD